MAIIIEERREVVEVMSDMVGGARIEHPFGRGIVGGRRVGNIRLGGGGSTLVGRISFVPKITFLGYMTEFGTNLALRFWICLIIRFLAIEVSFWFWIVIGGIRRSRWSLRIGIGIVGWRVIGLGLVLIRGSVLIFIGSGMVVIGSILVVIGSLLVVVVSFCYKGSGIWL